MSRMGLLRSFGPECRSCGCPMRLEDAGRHRNKPWAQFKCDFCNQTQTIGQSPAPEGVKAGPITYKTVRCVCPYCKAKNPPVVNTSPGSKLRWHKCDKCRGSFQSVAEED